MSYIDPDIGELVLFEGRHHRVTARAFDGFVPPYYSLTCEHDGWPCSAAKGPVTWHLLDRLNRLAETIGSLQAAPVSHVRKVLEERDRLAAQVARVRKITQSNGYRRPEELRDDILAALDGDASERKEE